MSTSYLSILIVFSFYHAGTTSNPVFWLYDNNFCPWDENFQQNFFKYWDPFILVQFTNCGFMILLDHHHLGAPKDHVQGECLTNLCSRCSKSPYIIFFVWLYESDIYQHKVYKIGDALALWLTLYTLTSVCIFSILFSIHFPMCWQGELV